MSISLTIISIIAIIVGVGFVFYGIEHCAKQDGIDWNDRL